MPRASLLCKPSLCRVGWRLAAAAALLAACAPPPTPFPVDIPPPAITQPAASDATAPTPARPPGIARYALAANAAGLVADLPLIANTAEIVILDAPPNPADLGERFDLIAAYGDLPGGTRSPVMTGVSLVINPAAPPFQDAALVNIIRRAFDTPALLAALDIPGAQAAPLAYATSASLRTDMANAGWPDGFDATLYAAAPGANAVAQALARLHIAIRFLPASANTPPDFNTNPAALLLIAWSGADERARWVESVGADYVLDLYMLPISYLAAPGLPISFTPGGWPIVQR